MARWIRPEKRAAIVARDEHTCCYCGKSHLLVGETQDGGRPHPECAHLDHIVPQAVSRARGERPDNRPTNLVVACHA